MRTRSIFAVVIAAVFLAQGWSQASAAPSEAVEQAAASIGVTASAKLTAPSEVIEGERFSVGIRLKSRKQTRRVHVQRRVTDVFGVRSWQTVKTLRVRSSSSLTYPAIAGEADRETFRVLLQTKSGGSSASMPVSVDVWHWYPLTAFESYYETGGVADYAGNQFAMNGRSYASSWYTYGSYRSWETRYTLGRHCRSMSGTFGVTDRSHDASSATVQVIADEVEPVYSSPRLTPGVVDATTTALASPYRISIVGANTSAANVSAYPAAGDLQFLCHGVA